MYKPKLANFPEVTVIRTRPQRIFPGPKPTPPRLRKMVYLLAQERYWTCARCLDSMQPGLVARVYLDRSHAETYKECVTHPACRRAEESGQYCDMHGDGNLHPDCADFETVH